MTKRTKFGRFLAATVFLLFLAMSWPAVPAAAAPAVDLVLCLDGSGSIGSSGFQQETEGTAAAIEDPAVVPQDGSVRITVLRFNHSVMVAVPPTVIDATNAGSVANDIRNIQFTGGGTDIAECIREADRRLSVLIPAADKQIIDISTDGVSNRQEAVDAANDAVAAGVDAINAIGIGSGADSTFLDQVVRPQPSSDPDGDEDGFKILVDDIADYAEAIKKKITREVARRCLTLVGETFLCPTDGSDDFTYTFEFVNDSGGDVHHLFLLEDLPLHPFPPAVSFSPNYIPFTTPVADGESREVEVEIRNAKPGQQITFLLTLHDEDLTECCAELHTVALPPCDCAQVIDEKAPCRLSFLPFDARWEYTFTVQNLFPGAVENILLAPVSPQGLTLRPNHLSQLSLAGVPYTGTQGQTTETVTIDGPLSLFGQEVCFMISAHDASYAECCSLERCVDLQPCVAVINDVRPIGNATLDFVGGHLLVRNIGASGDDGVGFDTGAAERFEVAWLDPEAVEALPAGALLRSEVEGPEPGPPLASAEVEKTADGLVVRGDGRSGVRRLELLRQGRVVETFPVAGSAAVRVPSGDWPGGASYFGIGINVIVIWPATTTVRLDEGLGESFEVDAVRFVMVESLDGVISGAAVTAADIPQIEITRAVATPASAVGSLFVDTAGAP